MPNSLLDGGTHKPPLTTLSRRLRGFLIYPLIGWKFYVANQFLATTSYSQFSRFASRDSRYIGKPIRLLTFVFYPLYALSAYECVGLFYSIIITLSIQKYTCNIWFVCYILVSIKKFISTLSLIEDGVFFLFFDKN